MGKCESQEKTLLGERRSGARVELCNHFHHRVMSCCLRVVPKKAVESSPGAHSYRIHILIFMCYYKKTQIENENVCA